MGMFDSLYLVVKCPFCGEEEERECQTKDMDCQFDVWRVGDFVTRDYSELHTIANCKSEKCSYYPYPHMPKVNHGSYFHPIVKLEDGFLTGEYEIKSA